MFLVKNGVPIDVAFNMPDSLRIAWTIALGELEGGEFDFQSMAWREKK